MSLVRHAATIAATFVAAHACADLARAQVPKGHAVVGTYTESGTAYIPGPPGLFIVPLNGAPVAPIRITGLPAELMTDGLGSYRQGAMSVSLRSSDGAVIVGTVGDISAPSAGQVSLYVFHLTGSAVTSTQHIVLGTTTDLGFCFTAVAPDDRILVVAGEAQTPLAGGGTMAGRLAVIVDTFAQPPTFQMLPNPTGLPSPAALGGAAFDPSGEYAYIVLSDFSGIQGGLFYGVNNARLFRMHMTTLTWCPIHNWPGESAFGIACDDDGSVYVSSTNPATQQHFIHTVQPDACNSPTLSSMQSSQSLLAWGLALDRASGWFVAPSYDGRPGFTGTQLNAVSMISPGGMTLVVAQPPAGGWGTIGLQGQGVAVNNQVESYGASSPGANHYWFDNFPNPSGTPTLGNAGFSLTTMSAPAAPQLSAIAMSLSRSSTSILGINVLINPAAAATAILPGSQSATFAFPIPNSAGLAGLELMAQSLHLEVGGGLAASRGLALTVQ